MNDTSPADRYESVEAAIAEGVLWREHDHRPRPCCTKAMLDAIPDGLGKVNGQWVSVVAVEDANRVLAEERSFIDGLVRGPEEWIEEC